MSINTAIEFEGVLIRKNISALHDALKKLENKLGSEEMRSKQAIQALIQRLENIYYEEAQAFSMMANDTPPNIQVEKDLVLNSKRDSILSNAPKDTNFDDWTKI